MQGNRRGSGKWQMVKDAVRSALEPAELEEALQVKLAQLHSEIPGATREAVEGRGGRFEAAGEVATKVLNCASEKTFRWPAVCIDLETLGLSADAVILEIGAVAFDPERGETGPGIRIEVAMRAQDQVARVIDEETLQWWMARQADGQEMPGLHGGETLWNALQTLAAWFQQARLVERNAVEVWAWGSDFDFAVLRDAHEEADLPLPWKYSNQCDARSFCKQLEVQRPGEVEHTALADAMLEAVAICNAVGKLRGMERAVAELAIAKAATEREPAAEDRGPLIGHTVFLDGTRLPVFAKANPL